MVFTRVNKFTTSVSGTSSNPITLRGSRNAILTTGDVQHGYGLYLNGVKYWVLIGFSVKTAQKGILLDSSSFNVILNVSVYNVGDEGIHFRCNSSNNILADSQVSFTGRVNVGYGEGNYF